MAPVNTAEAPMSRPEADEALSRLRADGDAFAAALMGLEEHPGSVQRSPALSTTVIMFR